MKNIRKLYKLLNVITYSKTKTFNTVKSYNKEKINSEEEKKIKEEELDLFRAYNYGDEEEYKKNYELPDEEEIDLSIILNELFKNKSSGDFNNDNINILEGDEEKTIDLDGENMNFHYENFITNNYKDQKILLKPFNINRNPDKSLVNYFLSHNDIYEEILQILFHFDYFL